jgi:hypothetical protein
MRENVYFTQMCGAIKKLVIIVAFVPIYSNVFIGVICVVLLRLYDELAVMLQNAFLEA